MSHFILVHGAWHNAWCWHKLAPLLEEQGHEVLTPDLPGHGKDTVDPAQVTLGDYVQSIKNLVHKQAGPVFLVGHSMAGIVISEVAEALPEKLAGLVYLTGFMLQDGESMLDVVQQDTGTLVLPNLVYSRDRKTATVKPEVVREAFYNDCSTADANAAVERLVPQPLAPIATPIHVSSKRWGRVPRIYIQCSMDRAVSPSIQEQMIRNLPCASVYRLRAGHSPFLSASDQLAVCLHEAVTDLKRN